MTEAVIIFFATSIYALITYLKDRRTYDLIIFIAAFVGAVATLVDMINTNEQTDNIEVLAQIDTSLSNNISKLSLINNEIASNTSNLAKQNLSLTDSVRNLNANIYFLVNKVNQLTTSNLNLSESIKRDTKYQSEVNANTGELNFNFDSPVTSINDFSLQLGSLTTVGTVHPFVFGNYEPVKIAVKNRKLILNATIEDFEHNKLVEIIDNFWLVNPHIKNKLNYDNKGIEVLDDKDNVVFSLDILPNNLVKIQGIIYTSPNSIMVFGHSKMKSYPNSMEYYEEINQSFKKLFMYTGKDWLHRRVAN